MENWKSLAFPDLGKLGFKTKIIFLWGTSERRRIALAQHNENRMEQKCFSKPILQILIKN